MKKLLEIIDAKLITSVGGILLAAALTFVLYKILTNEMPHLENAIRESTQMQAKIQIQTNEILLKNSIAIEGNTKVLEIIERRIK